MVQLTYTTLVVVILIAIKFICNEHSKKNLKKDRLF